MLVLQVKKGEVFWIGAAQVLIVDCDLGRVRVGITAPREIPIDRDEIRRRKEAEARKQREKHNES